MYENSLLEAITELESWKAAILETAAQEKEKDRLSHDYKMLEQFAGWITLSTSILRRILRGELVPVVHCGECKDHGDCDIEDCMREICHKSSSDVFCSEGERKDGEK